MEKKLIIINGTMGVGKTATSRELNKKLNNSVWLDGDWCWMMNPFTVNDENKNMVIKNITYLLRNFLINSSFEYVIFNWVIHYEDIFNLLLQPLSDLEFEIIKVTLLCSEETLKERILNDVKLNLRDGEELSTSLQRLELYKNMNTVKIDTTNISINETVDKIIKITCK
ncbi:AAA family ATPase [Clostridium autoethanogenum]|uniref:AAA family ATPase n=1 Tax=Clostridium autoethanogenum DSM 10061 TaxID=1341692 RepID=A0ABM5NZQ7_9CLOT|nr:AAA family ATPase [Clostridium autoethanogenum]AGY78177.1 AAA family ATPase [Clostridium autoethanogenum DSM 10061]ALU38310.1 AAA-ATPase-like protein [Clostridium autoethanogenum DSM 10061]OVY51073.1 Shikimate kinase [Clostridium autoethanogenum]